MLVADAIGYGLLFGAVAGVAGGLVARLARQHGLMESGWSQILPVATAASRLRARRATRRERLHRRIRRGLRVRDGCIATATGRRRYLLDQFGELANSVTFLVFGAAIAGAVLAELSWRTALYGVLSLTAVRMLPVAVALFGTHARLRTVAFVGWFGPRGLASIVFTVIALEQGTLAHASEITVAVVFTIVLSVYLHGLSAKPLTERYARWYRAPHRRSSPAWRACTRRTSAGAGPSRRPSRPPHRPPERAAQPARIPWAGDARCLQMHR